MRNSSVRPLCIPLLLTLVTVGSGAQAAGRTKAGAKKPRTTAKAPVAPSSTTTVASPEPLPPLPATTPPPPPASPALVGTTTTTSAAIPVAPKTAAASAAPPKAEAPVPVADNRPSPDGVVVAIGISALTPANAFVSGGERLGPGFAIEARAGYYVSQHIGFVGGFRGSFGHTTKSCNDDSCHGFSYQVPLMVEIAAANRARGFYGTAGVGLFSTYVMTSGDVTEKVSSPIELKLAMGYRLGIGDSSKLDRSLSADLHFGADLGRMTSADFKLGSQSASRDIDDPTIHVVFNLGVMGHFAL